MRFETIFHGCQEKDGHDRWHRCEQNQCLIGIDHAWGDGVCRVKLWVYHVVASDAIGLFGDITIDEREFTIAPEVLLTELRERKQEYPHRAPFFLRGATDLSTNQVWSPKHRPHPRIEPKGTLFLPGETGRILLEYLEHRETSRQMPTTDDEQMRP